jgi:hypothetical protein
MLSLLKDKSLGGIKMYHTIKVRWKELQTIKERIYKNIRTYDFATNLCWVRVDEDSLNYYNKKNIVTLEIITQTEFENV